MAKPAVETARRQYNQWVATESIEDYALRYSPSVSHYKAATELGYRVRPIHETVGDTLNWFAAAGS